MSDPVNYSTTNLTVATNQADAAAVAAVEQHHAQLAAELASRVEELFAAADRPGGPDVSGALAARDRLVDFCSVKLMPHAEAEEQVLYPVAAQDQRAKLLVESMIAEHRMLRLLVDELAATARPVSAAALALALRVLFDVHLAKENELILPLIAADPSASLAQILGGMHELLGEAAESCGHGECGCGHDEADGDGSCGCGGHGGHGGGRGCGEHEHATDAGCGCGHGEAESGADDDQGGCDCGCGGHGRSDDQAEPVVAPPVAPAPATHGGCGCGGHDGAEAPVLDVRQIPHAIRHATVFGAVAAVPAGATLVLVAPHDPLPLLAQLEAREPNIWTVGYDERGPEAWRLRLTRA